MIKHIWHICSDKDQSILSSWLSPEFHPYLLKASPSFLVLRENGKHNLDPDLGTSPINQSSSDWLTLQFLSNWLIPANQAAIRRGPTTHQK